RAQRSRRAGGALPPAAPGAREGRSGGPPLRRRIRAGAGARHAAGGGHRHRHRPAHHADDRPPVDPRRHPLPPAASGSGAPSGVKKRSEMPATPSSRALRNLPFPVLLALRYLRSTRRDAFASFLSAVAAGGIGLGVAALILSLAVISGFQEALRGEILGRTPQIEVDLPAGADALAARAAALAVPGVRTAQVQVTGSGWLVSRGKVQPIEMVGFEGRVPDSLPRAARPPEGLYVGHALA